MRTSTNYRALYLPHLTAGVGIKLATLLWMFVITVGILFDSFWIWVFTVSLGFCVHRILIWFTSLDSKIFEIYAIYILTKDVYDTGSNINSTKNRPHGYGKDMPC